LDSLSQLAADLRTGMPPAAAWADAAAWAGHAPAEAEAEAGAETMANAKADATAHEAAGEARIRRLAAAAWRLAESTGAPLADLIERVEADARAADRAHAAAAAQAAGARVTAWLLGALPAGGIALGYAIGADPLRILLRTPIGALCAISALGFQLAGLLWAERLAAEPRVA
jgi:tight adherence protein B